MSRRMTCERAMMRSSPPRSAPMIVMSLSLRHGSTQREQWECSGWESDAGGFVLQCAI